MRVAAAWPQVAGAAPEASTGHHGGLTVTIASDVIHETLELL